MRRAFPTVATDVTSRNRIKITPEVIRDTIQKTKNTKAPGLDNICNEHLKDTTDTLMPFWTELFNKCIQTGEIPNEWRTAKMKVLYKGKGDPRTPTLSKKSSKNSTFKTGRANRKPNTRVPIWIQTEQGHLASGKISHRRDRGSTERDYGKTKVPRSLYRLQKSL